jgi:integrase
MRAELQEAATAAGIGKLRPVELRHTATTIMAEHMPVHRVADVLGHTTTRMIEANYRHRPDEITAVDVLA